MDLKKYISEIKDFPKPGIGFKDMSPILENSEALEFTINSFEIANAGKINKIVGLDATGGSAKAAIDLIEKLGGIVKSLNFVIELEFLNGKEKFEDKKVVSLVKY